MTQTATRERKGIGLSTRIALVTLLVLAGVVAVNDWVFVSGYRRDAEAALADKAAGFVAVADAAVERASEMSERDLLGRDQMLREMWDHVRRGGRYEDTRFFDSISIIAAQQTAAAAAEHEHMRFSLVATHARNPDNRPVGFRAALLDKLRAQVAGGGGDSIREIDRATNTMHSMHAVTLTESCMACHGDPARYDARDAAGRYDGLDVLGYRMEGMNTGDMYGAYEVAMPLAPIDARVAGFVREGMMAIVPVVLVVGIVFVVLLRAMLGRPLERLIGVIASCDGDLTRRVNMNRRDEIGRLAAWFDRFMENLHGIVSDVSGATGEVAGAAAEIAASSEEMARGMGTQEQQVSRVSAAVRQMANSVGEVSRQSADAAGSATDSQRVAEGGGAVVNDTVEEMRAIADDVIEAARSVRSLGEKSDAIGEIVGVINGIADQTNLLALNAAIEAARAGEHGRGFAVVAEEVRKLAERITAATDEVGASMREIQGETAGVVHRIEAGSRRVEKGVDLAGDAGRALRHIVRGSQGLRSMVEGIATASGEQASATEEIARSIEAISSVTRESTEGAQQAAAAANALSEQGERLQRLVNRFKL